MLAAALAGDDGFPTGAAAKIRAAARYLSVAPAAVRGRTDVPLDDIADAIPPAPRDPARLVELVDALGLESPVNRMLAAMAAASTRTPAN